jgi:predicted nucleic acid-binding protein
MAGSVVDLSDPTVPLPSPIVVDTNIIVERFGTSFGYQPNLIFGPRVHDFFQRLARANATGFITPSIHVELAHVLVKFWYRTLLGRNKSALRQQFGQLSSWKELYKRDPAILQGMRSDFALFSHQIAASGIYFLDADELNPIPSGNPSDRELIEIICRYGLDSTDAMILSEAQRIPVLEIATLDADMLRAQADFTIYTWL